MNFDFEIKYPICSKEILKLNSYYLTQSSFSKFFLHTLTFWFRAIKSTYESSSGRRKTRAFPSFPILAVRPQRWTKLLQEKKRINTFHNYWWNQLKGFTGKLLQKYVLIYWPRFKNFLTKIKTSLGRKSPNNIQHVSTQCIKTWFWP